MPELPTTVVHLDTDEVDIVFSGSPQRLPCEVMLETVPSPRLHFKITTPRPWDGWALAQSLSVHIVRANVTCETFVSSRVGETITLTPHSTPIPVGQSQILTVLDFDLVNFPSFWDMSGASAPIQSDRLDLSVDGWHMELRPPRISPDVKAFPNTLYSVTHSCTIRKSNSGTFTSENAHFLVNALHDAFSFAAGRWVAPVFVRGSGADQQVLWKEWGIRPLHPSFDKVETWFDLHHPNTLAEILPGILRIRNDAARHETFHSALYWYLRSSGLATGVDGGIILLQSALERLSWQAFVTDRNALSPHGFRRLPAEDQIRLLIESCGIPTAISKDLADLSAKAKEFNWNDGPQALADVRNSLVHPNKRKDLPYYDAWRLSEWYVELVLLKMLGFNGQYSDRTKAQRWVGMTHPVPWAKP